MNRQEFILALREELAKLPPEEIVDATQYFEECFDEATDGLGEEARIAEEERLAAEFGNPKKIASQIKADYAARILGNNSTSAGERPGTKKKLSAVWWILIGICSAPIAIPIVICVFMMILCVLFVIIACLIAGIAAVVAGIAAFTDSAAAGFMTIGIGLMLAAASAAAVFGAFLGIREIVRAIAQSTRKRNEEKKASEIEMELSRNGEKEPGNDGAANDAAKDRNVSGGSAADNAANDEAKSAGSSELAADEIEVEVE